jgi:hypothetical protein
MGSVKGYGRIMLKWILKEIGCECVDRSIGFGGELRECRNEPWVSKKKVGNILTR